MIMSGNEAWNRNVFKRWQKVDRDGADITLSGRLFQMVGSATGKARPPAVGSLTDGTSRRLVRAERRERRPGRSATRTSWFTYGAVPMSGLWHGHVRLEPYSLLSSDPKEADECVGDVVGRRWAVLPRSSPSEDDGTGRQEDRLRRHFRSPSSTVLTRR